MAGHAVLVPGMSDADPHAAEFRPEMRVGRTDAVMPRGAAAAPPLDLERREVELVVEHRHILRRQLVEAHRLADRAAALVHEGGGLEQQDLLSPAAPFLRPALEF